MNIKFKTRQANRVDHTTLRYLRDELTNSMSRGDKRDDGTEGGSSFAGHIEDRIDGGDTWPNDVWIITATDKKTDKIVAWTMVARSDEHSGAASVGFYVAPPFRRRGLGGMLAKQASELAHRKGMRRVVADPWNVGSVTFFNSLGFKGTGEFFMRRTVSLSTQP